MISRLAVALAALIAAAPSVPVAPFSSTDRAAALDRIATQIEQHYVFVKIADSTAAKLRSWKNDRELLGAPDQRSFAALLTARLDNIDGHFNVEWEPASPEPAQSRFAADFDRRVASDNYGFQTVERLPGNIGYIRMQFFADFDPALTGDRAPPARRAGEAALALVQHSDAVIVDLRENGGGSPAMIDLLLSGFFGDKPVLLNRFYQRKGSKTIDFTTLANYRGVHRPKVPLYVLISGATASAAEEFAYDVQTQKRGLIVGEASYGGANPGERFDAGGGFNLFISTGAAVNPITHTNWERVGVKPDVAVSNADALATAERLALKQVVARGATPEARTEARWQIERLAAERDSANVAPKTPQDYVGDYDDRQVRLENGRLVYHRGRYPAHILIPLGHDEFALDARPDLRLTFERTPGGAITALVMTGSDGEVTSHAREPKG